MVVAWLGAVGIGWGKEIAQERLTEQLAARYQLGVIEERNVQAFLATGAFLPGTSSADWSIPYLDAAHLADVLSDPAVCKILPSVFQDAAAGGRSPERLRDGPLRAGLWLGIGGGLLMLLMILQPLPVGSRREAQPLAAG
jgi:hypothetical protein